MEAICDRFWSFQAFMYFKDFIIAQKNRTVSRIELRLKEIKY